MTTVDASNRWSRFTPTEMIVIEEALGSISDGERQSPYWADEADKILNDMPAIPNEVMSRIIANLNREKNT